MEFLGVGPLELFFILIIALIFLGPRDMVKAGRSMGKFMRKIVMSPTWRMVQQTSRELRTLPNRMIREAGMEEDIKDLDQLGKDMKKQIGSITKPFSAAAGEINQNIQAAQKEMTANSEPAKQSSKATPEAPAPPTEPAAQAGLAAWTTPPTVTAPADDSTAEQEPGPTGAPASSAPAENQNPNPS